MLNSGGTWRVYNGRIEAERRTQRSLGPKDREAKGDCSPLSSSLKEDIFKWSFKKAQALDWR